VAEESGEQPHHDGKILMTTAWHHGRRIAGVGVVFVVKVTTVRIAHNCKPEKIGEEAKVVEEMSEGWSNLGVKILISSVMS